MNILIVDDDQCVRDLLKSYLKETNKSSNIKTASCYKDMKLVMDKFVPNLIFLDILMPETDGIETLRYIRSEKKFTDIQVFMLTSLNDVHTICKCLQIGATGFLNKGSSLHEITTRVNHFIFCENNLNQI